MGMLKILSVIVLFVFTRAIANGVNPDGSSPTPPYTCTTTVCKPGLNPQDLTDNYNYIAHGLPGKKGIPGGRGEKGRKGDPCQCNATKDDQIRELKSEVERLEIQNGRLKALNFIGSPTNPVKSCFHLQQEGQNRSGIYTIQPSNDSPTITVFCDMQYAGGGWTLVASIHENNVHGKCTSGDLWSSDQGDADFSYPGNGNWENVNAFGTPQAATSADYKSEAYYSLQASDVMIWHVPNDVEIQNAHKSASLMYYTNTSFLNEYGGTLQSLFKQHYPLQKIEKATRASSVDGLISALNQSAADIRNVFPDFYYYAYDATNEIKDGGNDMYDTGNKLFYRINGFEMTRVVYNKDYRDERYGFHLFSGTSHPFNLLAWIGDGEETVTSFALQADGNAGADGGGSSQNPTGTVTYGSFSLTYQAFNIHAATDPSISQVFYFIQNGQKWQSVAPNYLRSPWTNGTEVMSHGIVLDQHPRRVLVGYTLLSRKDGNEITNSSIRSVMRRILSIIIEKRDVECNHLAKSLVQPVRYIEGNDTSIVSGIPIDSRTDITPGFLQFRAYNSEGVPNALCPGVQTTSCASESFCIGGINTMPDNRKSCGDFAGWGNTRAGSLQKSKPTSAGKSLDDINSSILIFTRKEE